MAYTSFKQCQMILAGVTAVDYFLAQRLINALSFRGAEALPQEQLDTLFHLLMALSQALQDGHTCLDLTEIANKHLWQEATTEQQTESETLTQLPGFHFASINELLAIVANFNIAADDNQPIVFEQQKLYLKRYYQFEKEVALHIQQMLGNNIEVDMALAKQSLTQLFSAPAFESPDRQKAAVANALNKQLSIIIGGPGTGKTTTVAKLLIALINQSAQGLNIKLAAPTGKAAQRLSESLTNSVNQISGQVSLSDTTKEALLAPASTLHRLLGVIPNSPNFKHNSDNLLDLDVLLLDEVSMVDLPMMARLLRALPSHAKLILLGDAEQLPSVAAGSILADLAPLSGHYSAENKTLIEGLTTENAPEFISNQVKEAIDCDHLAQLHFSHRFKGDGGIGLIANAVINGEQNQVNALLTSDNPELADFSNHSLLPWLQQLTEQYYLPLTQATSLDAAFSLLSNFRILCATRAGEQGIKTVNERVEAHIHKLTGHKAKACFHGKPIMVTSNLYHLNLYNGDIGMMWQTEDKPLLVAFEDANTESGYRFISLSRISHYDSVYGMTIHKTQGSEFGEVALLLPERDNPLLTRELLYTGITRAKKHLKLWAKSDILATTVSRRIKRQSGLKEKLFTR